MRWMMYRWWCEGGSDRAWWVIESVFLRLPDKGFWACLGDPPPDMPRWPDTWASLCNLMLKLCGISLSSAILGSDSPQSKSRKGNSIHSRERPNANTRYCWLFKATMAYTSACTDAGAALAPLLSGGTRVCHWQSARRLWPDTKRLQLPLDDCCRLVLSYNAVLSIQQTKHIPNDHPQMGAKSTITSNHPSTPMQKLHWLRFWAEEPGYATSNLPEDYGQIQWDCSFPWMIAVY